MALLASGAIGRLCFREHFVIPPRVPAAILEADREHCGQEADGDAI